MPNGPEGQDGTEDNPGKPPSRFEQDLVKWTKSVAQFTGLLFLANAIGLFFIYEQWKVASDAQTDTRQQLRALVTYQGMGENIINDPNGKPIGFVFQPTYFNSGGTRTAIFHVWQSIHYFEKSVPDNIDLTKPLEKIDISLIPSLQVIAPPIFNPSPSVRTRPIKSFKSKGLHWYGDTLTGRIFSTPPLFIRSIFA